MNRYPLVLLILNFFLCEATAFSPGRPTSRCTFSADEKFVFVLIHGSSTEEELKHWNDDFGAEIKAIRDRWPKSGMYRNDGSVVPLWTVDWYSYHVEVPSDGEHVVRIKTSGLGQGEAPAIGFYHRSELVQGYESEDLVSVPLLIDHGTWHESSSLDDESGLVTVWTITFDRYTFDFHTGEMTSRFRPLVYAFRLLVVLAILLPIWWVRRRRRRMALASR